MAEAKSESELKEDFKDKIDKLIRNDYIDRNSDPTYTIDTFKNELKQRSFNDLNRLELLIKIEIFIIMYIYKYNVFNADTLNKYLEDALKDIVAYVVSPPELAELIEARAETESILDIIKQYIATIKDYRAYLASLTARGAPASTGGASSWLGGDEYGDDDEDDDDDDEEDGGGQKGGLLYIPPVGSAVAGLVTTRTDNFIFKLQNYNKFNSTASRDILIKELKKNLVKRKIDKKFDVIIGDFTIDAKITFTNIPLNDIILDSKFKTIKAELQDITKISEKQDGQIVLFKPVETKSGTTNTVVVKFKIILKSSTPDAPDAAGAASRLHGIMENLKVKASEEYDNKLKSSFGDLKNGQQIETSVFADDTSPNVFVSIVNYPFDKTKDTLDFIQELLKNPPSVPALPAAGPPVAPAAGPPVAPAAGPPVAPAAGTPAPPVAPVADPPVEGNTIIPGLENVSDISKAPINILSRGYKYVTNTYEDIQIKSKIADIIGKLSRTNTNTPEERKEERVKMFETLYTKIYKLLPPKEPIDEKATKVMAQQFADYLNYFDTYDKDAKDYGLTDKKSETKDVVDEIIKKIENEMLKIYKEILERFTSKIKSIEEDNSVKMEFIKSLKDDKSSGGASRRSQRGGLVPVIDYKPYNIEGLKASIETGEEIEDLITVTSKKYTDSDILGVAPAKDADIEEKYKYVNKLTPSIKYDNLFIKIIYYTGLLITYASKNIVDFRDSFDLLQTAHILFETFYTHQSDEIFKRNIGKPYESLQNTISQLINSLYSNTADYIDNDYKESTPSIPDLYKALNSLFKDPEILVPSEKLDRNLQSIKYIFRTLPPVTGVSSLIISGPQRFKHLIDSAMTRTYATKNFIKYVKDNPPTLSPEIKASIKQNEDSIKKLVDIYDKSSKNNDEITGILIDLEIEYFIYKNCILKDFPAGIDSEAKKLNYILNIIFISTDTIPQNFKDYLMEFYNHLIETFRYISIGTVSYNGSFSDFITQLSNIDDFFDSIDDFFDSINTILNIKSIKITAEQIKKLKEDVELRKYVNKFLSFKNKIEKTIKEISAAVTAPTPLILDGATKIDEYKERKGKELGELFTESFTKIDRLKEKMPKLTESFSIFDGIVDTSKKIDTGTVTTKASIIDSAVPIKPSEGIKIVPLSIAFEEDNFKNKDIFKKYFQELYKLARWLKRFNYSVRLEGTDINETATTLIQTYFKNIYPHVSDPSKSLSSLTNGVSNFGIGTFDSSFGIDILEKLKPELLLSEQEKLKDPDAVETVEKLAHVNKLERQELEDSEKTFVKDLAGIAALLPTEEKSINKVLELFRNYFAANNLKYAIKYNKENFSKHQETKFGGNNSNTGGTFFKEFMNKIDSYLIYKLKLQTQQQQQKGGGEGDVGSASGLDINDLLLRIQKLEKFIGGGADTHVNGISSTIGEITEEGIADVMMETLGGAEEEKGAPGAGAAKEEISAAAPAVAPNVLVETAKKVLEAVEAINKNIRIYNESLSNIKSTYLKVYAKLIDEPPENEEDAKNPSKNNNQLDIDIREYLSATAEKPASKSLQQKIITANKQLESGNDWIKTTDENLKKEKDLLGEIFKQITDLLKLQPKTKDTLDKIKTVKDYFDGQLDPATTEAEKKKEGTVEYYKLKGLISTIEILKNKILNNYQTYSNKSKGIVESIAKEAAAEIEKAKIENSRQDRVAYRGHPDGHGGGDSDSYNSNAGNTDYAGIGGGVSSTDSIFELLESLQKTVSPILNALIEKNKRNSDPLYASSMTEPSLFSKLYNKYIDEKGSEGDLIASNNFVESLRANSLLPSEALKINSTDKIIFVFVTLFIRLLTVTIVETMITRNLIKNITFSLLAYFVLYAIAFVGAVVLVNSDTYRMRIVFNYLNLNGNSSGIIGHISALFIISFLIFFMNTRLNPELMKQSPGNLSDQDKVSLMYKFEVISMITWFFLLLIIALR